MRTGLARLYAREKKHKFEGTISRYGTRTNHLGEQFLTVCIVDVTYKNEVVADHVWLRDAKEFMDLDNPPAPGETVQFVGRVDMFPKGSYEVDFHIVDIEKVKVKRSRKAA